MNDAFRLPSLLSLAKNRGLSEAESSELSTLADRVDWDHGFAQAVTAASAVLLFGVFKTHRDPCKPSDLSPPHASLRAAGEASGPITDELVLDDAYAFLQVWRLRAATVDSNAPASINWASLFSDAIQPLVDFGIRLRGQATGAMLALTPTQNMGARLAHYAADDEGLEVVATPASRIRDTRIWLDQAAREARLIADRLPEGSRPALWICVLVDAKGDVIDVLPPSVVAPDSTVLEYDLAPIIQRLRDTPPGVEARLVSFGELRHALEDQPAAAAAGWRERLDAYRASLGAT